MLDLKLLEEIIKIPSPSGNEQHIKNYLVSFAKINLKKTHLPVNVNIFIYFILID